ncbi:DNA-binding transcriptional regulator, MerR family [Flavobacteriaceae bacterium MAR_2010_188]|nr:DNA-binding transcriptional regulator, MerR family [Flavobacteriaceae bacterium MAR_2010_188]
MNNVKSSFSIRDLENLSGIKAHTIRIWEKRYNLLQPERTDSNIRTYNLESLQKLLNISYLNNNGYKISKIAKCSDEEMTALVKEHARDSEKHSNAINSLKLAMINFDQGLFYRTYQDLERNNSFEEIFNDVIMPLLNEIGLLWQTDTITIANEHFITSLIRQQILLNIEKKQSNFEFSNDQVFVLFLPLNEIHELGLMFLYYILLDHGIQTIYLGQSVPMSSLKYFVKLYDKVTFVSYFTIKPNTGKVLDYLNDFKKDILVNDQSNFWVLGRKLMEVRLTNLPQNIKVFSSVDALKKQLKVTNKNQTILS